ncbi:hypothetical protein [Aquimarina algiphila]|uniref:RHS repeat-associated core domain-containing protein n=1 Tax=Aquimarina algiphila TaxID=2047982 RepID=A0A554VJN1_9FLAO|nr:hypothetical protein [Aquimarina algiphila]TSE08122.1 hypothetical protein FOF46_13780 [Aquimarina algiphila]
MKKLFLLCAMFFVVLIVSAQNPFEEFGYKPKISSLSKGKYVEYFDNDSIVQIGSILFNTYTNRIDGFVKTDTLYSEANLDPTIMSRWMNPDPLADEFSDKSPYNFSNNNPIRFVDPTGLAPEDWVKGENGDIYWDASANSQATTKEGETYLGKSLTFTFNSYIDSSLWDGPGGDTFAGDKLTSTIQITGNENSDGELTGITATKEVEIGTTPVGKARDHFPDLGEDQNSFTYSQSKNSNGTLSSYTLNFEQHSSVSKIEEIGLNIMGFDIVNVAQQTTFNVKNNKLSVSAATDVFPSATLSVNGSQLFKYNQPSFPATHGRSVKTTTGDNGRGGSTTREIAKNRPAPKFYKRH